jgi:hypothetical protein
MGAQRQEIFKKSLNVKVIMTQDALSVISITILTLKETASKLTKTAKYGTFWKKDANNAHQNLICMNPSALPRAFQTV